MDTLLALTLRSLMRRSNWVKYRHMLDDDTFPNTQAAALYTLIKDMHLMSKVDLDTLALQSAINATTQGDRCAELLNVIQEFEELDEVDDEQVEYAIRQYVARGKASQAARLVITNRDSPVFDYAVPAKLLADASRISSEKHDACLEVLDAGLPGDDNMVRCATPLGLSDALDDALAGGVGRGELLVVMAPFGRGKTSYLWRMASNAAQAGEGVWAATLEIKRYKCVNRYYQCITHLTNTELLEGRRLVAGRRKKVKGKLWIADYTSRMLTPSMVQAEVEQLRADGHEITYVMIDYAEIMRPEIRTYGKQEPKILGDMMVDLRRVANVLDVPIVTAWQVNRVGSTKLVFGPDDVSESWEVVKHADIILGLNQSDHEAQQNVMRIKIMKQREDVSRNIFYLHSDLRRMNITDLEGSSNGEEEEGEASL